MYEGGENAVAVSLVKCKIKRSNNLVVQRGGCLDRQQWTMCVVYKKKKKGSFKKQFKKPKPAIMCFNKSQFRSC
jgi:hypothetical protein